MPALSQILPARPPVEPDDRLARALAWGHLSLHRIGTRTRWRKPFGRRGLAEGTRETQDVSFLKRTIEDPSGIGHARQRCLDITHTGKARAALEEEVSGALDAMACTSRLSQGALPVVDCFFSRGNFRCGALNTNYMLLPRKWKHTQHGCVNEFVQQLCQ